MRRFHLVRTEDISGVSGIGKVTEGLEFSDGTIAMKWLTPMSIVEIAPNIHTIEAIHGHGGLTKVVWEDSNVA